MTATTTEAVHLAVEPGYAPGEGNYGEGFDDTDQILWRPAGVYLANDTRTEFWMVDGYSYDLSHDGTGWTVLLQDGRPYGGDGHTRHLARDGELATWLRNDHEVHLDPAASYRITMAGGTATLTQT